MLLAWGFSNRLLLIRHFFCKPYWATPFKMHFGFHTLSRETFAKISLSADPSHQQGAHERKSQHQGPWCLALAKPRFGKLGCCIWSLFIETSEGNVRQYQRQVQAWASRPWYLAAWLLPSGTILLPDPRAAGGGSP